MQINRATYDRMCQSLVRSEALGTIFEAMLPLAQSGARPEFVLDWQQPGDEFAEGDLLPTIVLVLRPAPVTESPPTEDAP